MFQKALLPTPARSLDPIHPFRHNPSRDGRFSGFPSPVYGLCRVSDRQSRHNPYTGGIMTEKTSSRAGLCQGTNQTTRPTTRAATQKMIPKIQGWSQDLVRRLGWAASASSGGTSGSSVRTVRSRQ